MLSGILDYNFSLNLMLLKEEENEAMSDNDELHEDYNTIMEQFRSKWLLTEINHSVSKTACDAFWNLGLQFFTKLDAAQGRRKKNPQFKTIRRQMYANLIPEIELEIVYRHKTTGEITVVKDSITPLKRFNTATYEKLYEIGTVKVKKFPKNVGFNI